MALGGVIAKAEGFEDYRLEQAKNLLTALRLAMNIALKVKGHAKELASLCDVVKTAERFLEVK